MSDFTYSIPFSNEKLLAGIIYQLKRDNLYDIANLLKVVMLKLKKAVIHIIVVVGGGTLIQPTLHSMSIPLI